MALVFLIPAGDDPCADKGKEKPVPRKETADKFAKALAGRKNAEVTADLTVGTPIRLPVTDLPIRIVSEDEKIADHSVEAAPAKVLVLDPKGAGKTKVKVTFGDPKVKANQFVVTLVVRVRGKP
jgi:hypothetical protein